MEKVTRIELTWAGLLNPIILILTEGTTANARRYAREELENMAEAADLYNAAVKSGALKDE